MSIDRSGPRNVFIWDLNDNEDRIPLGGLALSNGITNKDFHQMVYIVLLVNKVDFILQDENGEPLPEDDEALRPGNYYVAGDIVVSFIYSILFLSF